MRKDKQTGFTMIELLAVITIIGALAAIAIPRYLNQRASAHDAQVTSTTRPLVEDIESLATTADGNVSGDSDAGAVTVAGRALAHATTMGVHWNAAGTTSGYCVALWSDKGHRYTASNPLLYDSTQGATLPAGVNCATGNPSTAIGSPAVPPSTHISATYDLNAPGCDTNTVDLPTTSNDPMTVNWGDGTTRTEAPYSSHTYATRGVYHLLITANSFTSFKTNMAGGGNPACLISVDEWTQATGTVSLSFAFAYARNVTFVAKPPVPITNLSWTFYLADKFDGDVSGWDVTQAPSLPFTFRSSEAFTGRGIDTWDVSHMTGGNGVFYGASKFDADLSAWDTSHFTNLSSAFLAATSFTGKGLEHWDVSHVTNLASAFGYATAFNADISGWDTHAVTSMKATFNGAVSFNRDLSAWNVSGVLSAANHQDFATGATAWLLPKPLFTS